MRARSVLRSLAAGMLLWPMAAVAEPSADAIAVNVDQARLVKLPARVATIVVGNPLIADVALQAGGVIVVTGKGYGMTNFIALDTRGTMTVINSTIRTLLSVKADSTRQQPTSMPTIYGVLRAHETLQP